MTVPSKWTVLIRRNIEWRDLEALQHECRRNLTPGSATLILSEPTATLTRGRAAQESDLLWSESQLQEKGIAIAPVSRGGKWTYHGPGQLVAYPILNLREWGYSTKGARQFVETLRDSVVDFLGDLGVPSERREEPYGIYVGNAKLASFGLNFENGISSHGLALYLRSQKDPFTAIHPCGAANLQSTSLEEQNYFISWEDAASQIADHIKKRFTLERKTLL